MRNNIMAGGREFYCSRHPHMKSHDEKDCWDNTGPSAHRRHSGSYDARLHDDRDRPYEPRDRAYDDRGRWDRDFLHRGDSERDGRLHRAPTYSSRGEALRNESPQPSFVSQPWPAKSTALTTTYASHNQSGASSLQGQRSHNNPVEPMTLSLNEIFEGMDRKVKMLELLCQTLQTSLTKEMEDRRAAEARIAALESKLRVHSPSRSGGGVGEQRINPDLDIRMTAVENRLDMCQEDVVDVRRRVDAIEGDFNGRRITKSADLNLQSLFDVPPRVNNVSSPHTTARPEIAFLPKWPVQGNAKDVDQVDDDVIMSLDDEDIDAAMNDIETEGMALKHDGFIQQNSDQPAPLDSDWNAISDVDDSEDVPLSKLPEPQNGEPVKSWVEIFKAWHPGVISQLSDKTQSLIDKECATMIRTETKAKPQMVKSKRGMREWVGIPESLFEKFRLVLMRLDEMGVLEHVKLVKKDKTSDQPENNGRRRRRNSKKPESARLKHSKRAAALNKPSYIVDSHSDSDDEYDDERGGSSDYSDEDIPENGNADAGSNAEADKVVDKSGSDDSRSETVIIRNANRTIPRKRAIIDDEDHNEYEETEIQFSEQPTSHVPERGTVEIPKRQKVDDLELTSLHPKNSATVTVVTGSPKGAPAVLVTSEDSTPTVSPRIAAANIMDSPIGIDLSRPGRVCNICKTRTTPLWKQIPGKEGHFCKICYAEARHSAASSGPQFTSTFHMYGSSKSMRKPSAVTSEPMVESHVVTGKQSVHPLGSTGQKENFRPPENKNAKTYQALLKELMPDYKDQFNANQKSKIKHMVSLWINENMTKEMIDASRVTVLIGNQYVIKGGIHDDVAEEFKEYFGRVLEEMALENQDLIP